MTKTHATETQRLQRIIRPQRLLAIGLLSLFVLTPLFSQTEKLDEAYTAKIREFTTEPFFMTKYVDHLPAAEGIPTPLDVLGRIAGAPDILSYSHEIYKYMKTLADASPRVEYFTIGKTEEGRDMILVIVSDEETIQNLDRQKEIHALLADPRKLKSEEEAGALLREAKPMYWATGALHSGETGSPEMLMELAYRVAVGESEFIRSIRENAIIMITPVLEVDGRDKQVDIAMAPRKDPDAVVPRRLLYWGRYVAHDNNRDTIGLGLNITNNILETYFEYYPQVIHDLHESIAYLYTSTGTGPYNAWVDPILVDEWHELAYREVGEMTRLGVPGVWTHGFYDGWAPNYMFYVANGHNSIGRFYETQTAGDGSTRVIRSSESRDWYRPNPPLAETVWSLRNNVNMQQSAILIAMNHIAVNADKFMENFYLKSRRSIAKARAEGPAAYVVPADNPRPGQAASMLRKLQKQGVEIHRLDAEYKKDKTVYAKGSYVIRMDQPYSRMADLLLDKQFFNTGDPRPYDDVGWTMGSLYNIDTVRVEDTAILDTKMDLIETPVRFSGGIEKLKGSGAGFLINHDASIGLATFRFAHPDLNILAAEKEFEVEKRKFNAGSFILKTADNPSNLRDLLGKAGEVYEFTAFPVDEIPDVSSHVLGTPRIAVMHTWQTTQTEGWLRMGLDKLHIPYDYISVHDVRDNPDLGQSYDVIIFGPERSDALGIVDGLPMTGKPMPWKKSDVTPNIGVQDETDDMRGGLELKGVMNLYNFVKGGGLFITLAGSSDLPIHFGMSQGLRITQTNNLWARGGVFAAEFSDMSSPIAYGYGKELGVYFNSAPVFGFGRSGFGRRFGMGGAGQSGQRISGRGEAAEKDIVQGRPQNMSQKTVEAFREAQKAEAEEEEEEERPRGQTASVERARVVLRFVNNEKKLLISGGLEGGSELTGTPAVADARVGEGHVVMFSINPFWRNQTQGSYLLVLNAAMNWKNLDAGLKD